MVIRCWDMKANFSSMDEYEPSTGRPRWASGMEGSSSDGRMTRRGGRATEEEEDVGSG